MRGENAALIVQAEDHILNARRELYTAMDRIRELENRLPKISTDLETIRINIQGKINNLGIDDLQAALHKLW
jgi:hypothetical protein